MVEHSQITATADAGATTSEGTRASAIFHVIGFRSVCNGGDSPLYGGRDVGGVGELNGDGLRRDSRTCVKKEVSR